MSVKWTRNRPGLYVNGRGGLILRMDHREPEHRWSVSWRGIFGKEHRDVATLAEAKRVVSRGH